MKLSQKELEMLSNTNIDRLIDDLWWYINTPVNIVTKDEKEAHVQRLSVFTLAISATHRRQRREIDRLIQETNTLAMQRADDGAIAFDARPRLEAVKEELKAAFRGEFQDAMKHVPTHLADIEELFVIQLCPAFPGHPDFPVTYYAGYSKAPKWEAITTHDIHAAARWSAKDEAQVVAEALLPTLSCVWKVVEA